MTEVERLMSEIVDLLAADPGQNVDPRAWAQLLIYTPRFDESEAIPHVSRLADVVQAVLVASRNIALDTAIGACEVIRDTGNPGAAVCVLALRDLKAMVNQDEKETRQ